MRKKFLLVLAALLSATAAAFGLTACEGGHTHSYKETVVAATCTEKGYTLKKCDCGEEVKSDYTDALGHSFTDYVSDNNATCTSDGTKTAKCDRCDVKNTMTDEGSVIAHTPSAYIIDKEPTCTEQGDKHIECTVCKKILETSKIPAAGHTFVYGKCTVCDAVEPVSAVNVSTEEELRAALKDGSNVSLQNDITLDAAIEITSSVRIFGNNNKLELSQDSKSNRAITINDTENVTAILFDVEVIGPMSGGDTRGVSIADNDNLTLVMYNCSVSTLYYALNLAGDYNDGIKVIAIDSVFDGYCAFQTHTSGTKAVFDNCTLTSDNDWDKSEWNDFATIVVNASAQNADITLKGYKVEANQSTGNSQDLLSVRKGATGVKVTFEDCKFAANGEEITKENIESYLDLQADDTVLTIK